MDLDIRHLRLLVAVADAGALSAAARDLGVAQPTVSVQLRRIEGSVGFDIFERHRDGVDATEPGRTLLWHARGILRDVDGMVDDVRAARSDPTVHIVAAGPGLDEALPDLVRGRPGARWVLTNGSAVAGIAAVAERRATLLVLALHEEAEMPALPAGVEATPAVSVGLQAMLPAGHPAVDRPVVDLGDLAGDRWVAGTGPDALDLVLRECRAPGIEPDVAVRVDGPSAVERLVEAGAVTVGPPRRSVRPGVVLRPYHGARSVGWFVIRRRDGAPAELVAEVVAALVGLHGGPAPGLPGEPGIGTLARPLRVGSGFTPQAGALPSLLRSRGIVTSMSLAGDERLVAEVDAGRLDVVLRHDYRALPFSLPAGWAELTAVEAEPIMVVVPPGHALEGRDVVELAELEDESWVLPSAQIDPERKAYVAMMAVAGFTPRVAVSVTHEGFLPGILEAFSAVTLVGCVPPGGELRAVRLADACAYRRVTVGWRRENGLDAPAAAVAAAYADLLRRDADPLAAPALAVGPDA